MLNLTNTNKPTKRGNSLVDTFFDNFFDVSPSFKTPFKLDVKEQDDNYIVEADLPGVKKDEVKINYENDNLVISVERKQEKEEKEDTDEKEGGYIHRERSYESMKRALYMPDIDASNVKAKLEDGVLRLNLKKKTIENKGTTIEVE